MKSNYKGYIIEIDRLPTKEILYKIRKEKLCLMKNVVDETIKIYDLLKNCKSMIDDIILTYEDPTNEWAIPNEGM